MPMLALLAAVLVLAPTLARGDACFNHNMPIQDLNTPSGGWVDIFLDKKFNCATTIIGWEFYASSLAPTDTFYATVWRKLENTQKIQLIGKNEVKATKLGEQKVDVCLCDQIDVLAGDFIGVQYAVVSNAGVVPYEFENEERTSGLTLGSGDFSAIVAKRKANDDVPVGFTMTVTSGDKKGTIAMKPLTRNDVCNIQK